MDNIVSGYPFWVVWLFLLVVAMLRGQMTYWLGRLARNQTLRSASTSPRWWGRICTWLNSEHSEAGRTFLERRGLPAISLAYLTIGFQTVVLLVAGFLHIRALKFVLAQLPGAAAWATIYSTIGFAAWAAAARAIAGNVWPLAVIAMVGTAIFVGVRQRRRSNRVGA